ncbi:MAG: hypothetical protein ACTHL3_05535 [Candidatus Nitrosocosmicus sp.]
MENSNTIQRAWNLDWIGREYEKTKKGNRIKPKFSFYDNAERKISS